ncbi:unnamed protein product [Rotaria magnacalcarata]|uniref:DYW domain-containing protein n=1 Tax=Rotaria magnacalcarata TaxID=392030 RepID=A0A816GC05_9BILA|nr:unnamed protein product [Rotaria magnacalcarata]CAF3856300.1 unnamed protein product [Rotaria magnacalcarata]
MSSSTKLNATLKTLVDSKQYEEALKHFDQQPNLHTDFSIDMAIKACTMLHDYKRGINILQKLSSNSLSNHYIQISLIRFYMECRDVDNAYRVFASISNKSNYGYTAMFKGLRSNGMPEKIIDLLEEMKIEPDNFTLTLSFHACAQVANERAMRIGQKLIHKLLTNSQNEDIVLNAATYMLIKFGDIVNAERFYKSVKNKNIITYCTIMKGYIEKKMFEQALDLFEHVNLVKSDAMYTMAFNVCAKLGNDRAIKIGNKLLDELSDNRKSSTANLTSALHMLMKFGNIQNAERVFELIQKKDVIAYGAMIKGYVDNEMFEKALDLFEHMNCDLDHAMYTMAFSACAKLGNDRAIKIGNKLFDELPDNCKSSTTTLNSALHMLMKFGNIQNAERVFKLIPKKSVITYGAMMKGYVDNEMFEKALDLFEEMSLVKNDALYTTAFNVCAKLGNDRAMKIGNKLLDELPDNSKSDTTILTSAIHMLMKFGNTHNAERVFELIQKKDVITYGAMLKGYVDNEMFEKALDLFEQMNLETNDAICTIMFNVCAKLGNDRAIKIGNKLLDELSENHKSSTANLTSAMHMLMKFGDIQNAERVFKIIEKKDLITYGALMNGYNMNDQSDKCFKVFEEMKHHNIVPDESTWTILIGTYSQIAMIRQCEYLVNQIPPHILNKQQIQNALIDMWGKCGAVERAKQIFNTVSEPDTVTYGSMINALGLNGMGCEALNIYKQMPHNLRTEIAEISVLNACSHSGLLREAQAIFNEISVKTEKITGAMIDCYSRMFLFDEAEKLIDDYEKTKLPSFTMYMSLLSGARNNRDTILSEKIFNRMLSLFPDEKDNLMSGVILVSNTYSSLGEDEQAHDFRSHHQKKLGTRVKVGLSWTEVNGEVTGFSAYDRFHPSSLKIQTELSRIAKELIENGHQFNSSCITRRLNEGETVESVLMGHSEKIAIAFNFIQEPIPEFIQIRKNLRVCFDCHAATKLIAKIRQRDIIIRDANRIHHFQRSGQCSCQDHF